MLFPAAEDWLELRRSHTDCAWHLNTHSWGSPRTRPSRQTDRQTDTHTPHRHTHTHTPHRHTHTHTHTHTHPRDWGPKRAQFRKKLSKRSYLRCQLLHLIDTSAPLAGLAWNSYFNSFPSHETGKLPREKSWVPPLSAKETDPPFHWYKVNHKTVVQTEVVTNFHRCSYWDCIQLEHRCMNLHCKKNSYHVFLYHVCAWELSRFSCAWLFATPWTVHPTRLLCPWDSPGKNTGVGCHDFLTLTFSTQGLNLHLLWPLHCRWIISGWATREVLPIPYYVPDAARNRLQWVLLIFKIGRASCRERV